MDNLDPKKRFNVDNCLKMFFLVCLCAMVSDLLNFSHDKLGCEITNPKNFKKDTVPQQMKDGTIVNGLDTLNFDTLRMKKNTKTYIIKRNKNVRQK